MNERRARSRWLSDATIRNKIILIYIPLVIIPLLVTGIVSNRMYTSNIVKKTEKSISDNSRLIATQVEGIARNAESCANILTLNLNRVIHDEGQPTDEPDARYVSLLTNQLSFALLVFPDVDAAAFIDAEGYAYASNPSLLEQSQLYFDSGIYERLYQSSGNNVWFPMEKRSYLSRSGEQTVLTLGKKVSDIATGRTLGWLILNVDENRISRIFPINGALPSEMNYLADAGGKIVSSVDKEALLRLIGDEDLRQWATGEAERTGVEVPYRERGTLAIGHPLAKLGLTLVSVVPMKELTKETRGITLFVLVLVASGLLLVVASAGLLSKTIATPIVRLTRTMRKVKEESLDPTFDVQGKDEIGLLGEGFNSMIGRIRRLLEEIAREQKSKREYELALIQAQIKPHFLYNTLDVIYALSGMGRDKDVQRTTKALADYYRIVLSKGREIITLGQELQNVRDYLAIQKMRYADVFDYEIDVPSELHAAAVLKMTLQPLVENAIYHGLKPADRFGKLTIKGEADKDGVKLVVKDDGVGISFAKIEELSNRQEADGISFGVSSVDRRIKLYFGDSYGLQLTGEPGQGTEAIVTLPFEAPDNADVRSPAKEDER
ncbi:sensor histidine kinase [Cohnella suwonensis]|uniref:histidine kinase n=1 Tax=Cohnella suwonensis TaxID=696072 RepID=A0ABW0LYG5_9BACL